MQDRTTRGFTIAWLCLGLLLVAGAAHAGGDRVRLEARLSAMADAGDVSGKARFESREDQNRRKFSVEIEGFTPGEVFAVIVNGEETGVMVEVNDLGVGEVDLDDRAAEEIGDLPFPDGFPDLAEGDDVVVGPLKGTLRLD